MNKKMTLIQELYRLLREYPTEEWESLQSILNNEPAREILNKIAKESTNINKNKNPKKQITKTPKLQIIDEIIDDEKRQLLTQFRNLLREKVISPTAGDLRNLAEASGMKLSLPRGRNQAIDKIILSLVDKDVTEAKRTLDIATKGKADLNEEYLKWVDHILGR